MTGIEQERAARFAVDRYLRKGLDDDEPLGTHVSWIQARAAAPGIDRFLGLGTVITDQIEGLHAAGQPDIKITDLVDLTTRAITNRRTRQTYR